jgi:uncharacterized protein
MALDFLRGFAILGILIMNIQSFSMPGAAYLNPAAYGDLTGANRWVWILSHVFADQKFMTIFSILFGAGIILVTDRAAQKTGRPAKLHYSRTFWLLIIGLIHAHLIWYGDILVPYALCAFFVYLFRKKSPRTLLILGLLFFSVHTLIYGFFGSSIAYWPQESLDSIKNSWQPDREFIQNEIAAVAGSLKEQVMHNSNSALMLETTVFLFMMFWRVTGLMLTGMAFYKLGVLSAKKSRSFYLRGMVFSWVLGFPLVVWGVVKNFEMGWTVEYSMFLGSQFNYWGSFLVSFGYICGLMLLAQSDRFKNIKKRLAAVGQMALTNYITQSLICVLIFFGAGFGLFGEIERTGQVLIMLGIWLLQLVWSPWWLSRYRFGPLEWAWRSLTYSQKQQWQR